MSSHTKQTAGTAWGWSQLLHDELSSLWRLVISLARLGGLGTCHAQWEGIAMRHPEAGGGLGHMGNAR